MTFASDPAPTQTGLQQATFAAGCFWGVESAFREVEGVVQTAVGYTGGATANPTYDEVCHGATGHAEAIEICFDPAERSYDDLLEVFWVIHNPTTPGHQGWDFGDQYRSAIFTHTPEQARLACASREAQKRLYGRPVVTEVAAAQPFHRAEEYHQRYFEKNGGVLHLATSLR